jgi:hypothetical protein
MKVIDKENKIIETGCREYTSEGSKEEKLRELVNMRG